MSDSNPPEPPPRSNPGVFDLDPPPEVDPNKFGPVPIVSVDDEPEPAPTGAELPHWTEPATGQVPKVVATTGSDDWNDLAGPRWHGEGPEWAGDDLGAVLGERAASEPTTAAGGRVIIDDSEAPLGPLEPSAGDPQRGARRISRSASRPTARAAPRVAVPGVERNIPQAIGVGLAVAALALLAFRLSGVTAALALITVAATLAAIEVFGTMRMAGSHPASLLGIVACGVLPVAAYHRGDAAFPLVLGLTVVFGSLWYLAGADTQRPALNLGLTFLGVGWVGVLAGFAGLMVAMDDGKSIVVVAIICTAVYDTAALAGGKLLAKPGHAFHPVSPSKTWEGTITGVVGALVAAGVIYLLMLSPFSDDWFHALLLGLVVGILAPMGDLAQSMVKRDLGVKDMGTLLPGHGGVLDRLDGLLFVLPGVYYLALLLGYT